MNRKELLGIFAILEANYEPQFAKRSNLNKQAMVNLWAEHFADKDYSIVKAAVDAYIATDTTGFVPNVGQINEQIRNLTEKDGMTEQEAVGLIIKACGNSIYNSQEEFDKLPPILQRLAVSPAQLREWAMMDSDVLHSVVASNLMRSYKAISEKERQRHALPSSVKALLEQASEKMSVKNLLGEGSKEQ